MGKSPGVCVLYACEHASYLVTVQCVLGRAGSDGDGVWLAASIPLTVQLLSIPAGMHNGTDFQ